MSNEAVSKTEYETLAAFRYALRRFLHFSEAAAQQAGLTPQQHQALLAIQGYPGRSHATIGELAERLQIRHHSAVGLADRLVALGLLQRQTATSDRRQVYVRLTEKGEAMLAALTAAHREELHRLGPQLHLLLERITSDDAASAEDAPSELPGT